ncbi:MAG: radical SAM protein [Thermodesulfobacteriota bacterium]
MTVAPAFVQADRTGRVLFKGQAHSPDLVLEHALGPAFTAYRRKWETAGRFEYRPEFPLHLDVDTNFTCNLRCVMCPLGVEGFPVAYEEKHLDFELYRRVIATGAPKGLASVRLGLTGEPLLRPDIIEFVRLARTAGLVDIMLITNGQLLTPPISRSLIDAGLTRLMVSLDAVRPETYRRIRRGGSLDRVVRNIMTFLELRRRQGRDWPLLRVSFIRMTLNLEEAEEFEDYWRDKADYIGFQQYSNILERPDTDFSPAGRTSPDFFRCPDPWQRLSLLVNGDLFPCCSDFGRLAPLGNARRDETSRVWESAAAERLRDLHKDGRWREDHICRRCVRASAGIDPGLSGNGS